MREMCASREHWLCKSRLPLTLSNFPLNILNTGRLLWITRAQRIPRPAQAMHEGLTLVAWFGEGAATNHNFRRRYDEYNKEDRD